jgi:mono/diheme cytochrome c family protein
MKTSLFIVPATAVFAVGVLALVSLASSRESAANDLAERSRIERGRYLVHQVSLCIDCHSPRGEQGRFIEEKHLTGSELGFKPTVAMPWMPVAPKIAGLPEGYTSESMVHFLMTGERPNGRPGVLPPMPSYRLERADAEAMTAYLRSLK